MVAQVVALEPVELEVAAQVAAASLSGGSSVGGSQPIASHRLVRTPSASDLAIAVLLIRLRVTDRARTSPSRIGAGHWAIRVLSRVARRAAARRP